MRMDNTAGTTWRDPAPHGIQLYVPVVRKDLGTAFTVIELLVVLSIVSLLLALLLPAVQKARDAARAAQCKSNLRQLAMAVHAYEGAHGYIPAFGYFDLTAQLPPQFRHHKVAIQAQLLPFLDEERVYARLNLSVSLYIDYSGSPNWYAMQTTARDTRVNVFICPNDSNAYRWTAPNNYRGNFGLGPHWFRDAEHPDSGIGLFSGRFPPKLSHVTDGLANTAMLAERMVGSGDPDDDRFAGTIRDAAAMFNGPCTADDTLLVCAALSALGSPAAHYPIAGRYWLFTGIHHTLYTHALPPNAAIYDCQNFGFVPPVGAAAARSTHPGGVHVATADGSVRFVDEYLSLRVWRALGTRAEGELLADVGL